MTKLTNSQLAILSQAAKQEGGAAIVPEQTNAASIRKATEALLSLKLVREVLTKPGMPVWRKAEDGRPMSLVILKAGRDILKANDQESRYGPPALTSNPRVPVFKSLRATVSSIAQPRIGSKLALVISMLSNEAGATLGALGEVTGWLPHTTRAALTGLRKRGFAINRVRDGEQGTLYRLMARPTQSSAA
jgi:hypothetical protein